MFNSIVNASVPNVHCMQCIWIHFNRLKVACEKNIFKLQNQHWSEKQQQHIFFVLMVSQLCARVLTIASSPAQRANGFGWSEMPSRAGATLSWFSCHSPKWAAKSIAARRRHSAVSPEVLALLNKNNIRTRWDEAWNAATPTCFSPGLKASAVRGLTQG